MSDLQSYLPAVLEIARAAGREVMQVYSGHFEVAAKADRTPLTEADLRSQRVIETGLRRLTPAIPILAEEASAIPFAERAAWPEFWLVDPLDGTREFVDRNPQFTVNIALVRAHRPVLGVVHVPAQDRDYFAAEGRGACRQDAPGAVVPIRVCRPAATPLRVVGSRSHRGDSLDALLPRLGPHVLKAIGSSLKMCLVAEGEADFYPRLGPTSAWDTAAAQAVVECAGGFVVDLQGQPLRYNTGASVLNPHFLVYGDDGRNWLTYFAAARPGA